MLIAATAFVEEASGPAVFGHLFEAFLLFRSEFAANALVDAPMFFLGLRGNGVPKLFHPIVAFTKDLFEMLALDRAEVKLPLHPVEQLAALPDRPHADRAGGSRRFRAPQTDSQPAGDDARGEDD